MLVGSGEETAPNSRIYESYVGELNPERGGNIRRKIVLQPDNLSRPVEFFNPPNEALSGVNTLRPYADPEKPGRSMCDVAIIDRANAFDRLGAQVGGEDRRFTLSEPATGYPDRIPGKGSLWSDTKGLYVYGTERPDQPYPLDTPLDDDINVGPLDPDLAILGTV